MLAQTCSQIGADSSVVKPLLVIDKQKKPTDVNKSPSAHSKTIKSNGSPPATHFSGNSNYSSPTSTEQTRSNQLTFKPYANNVYIKSEDRPSSKASSSDSDSKVFKKSNSKSPDIRAVQHSHNSYQVHNEYTTHNNSVKSEPGKVSPSAMDRKTISPSTTSQRDASPINRSGHEVIHEHHSPKENLMGTYKQDTPYAMNPSLAAMCFPPGMEHHLNNPAFRPPFASAVNFSHHHAAMLAVAAGGYQATPSGQHPGPYVSYARVKSPAGGDTIVPVCKDPYCTGCQFSSHNQQMMMGVPCPAGCTQCEHQKFGLAMAMSGLPPSHPYAQLGRPYICNWIAADNYCGKRFTSSDDLLQHLRSHTASLADPAAAAAALAQSQQQAVMHPLGSMFNPSAAAAFHRAYAQPQLSPISAAAAASRYHPYNKSGALGPGSIPPGSSPYASAAFNPALNPYYSPYAMYGQRLGAAP